MTAARASRQPVSSNRDPDTFAGAVFDMVSADTETVTFAIPDHAHRLVITWAEWERFTRPRQLWVNVELIPEGAT